MAISFKPLSVVRAAFVTGLLMAQGVASACPTTSWVFCGKEDTRCVFTGTHTVAFGVNESFYYLRATNGIDCNDATFGDPAYGLWKNCYTIN